MIGLKDLAGDKALVRGHAALYTTLYSDTFLSQAASNTLKVKLLPIFFCFWHLNFEDKVNVWHIYIKNPRGHDERWWLYSV